LLASPKLKLTGVLLVLLSMRQQNFTARSALSFNVGNVHKSLKTMYATFGLSKDDAKILHKNKLALHPQNAQQWPNRDPSGVI
jgi:hypothetical protein